MNTELKGVLKGKITTAQCKDAGMAFVLLLLILKYVFEDDRLLILAVAILVITMSAPGIVKPLAIIWFGLTQYVGTYVSKIILYLIFYTIVVPVGMLRRLLQKDPLKLKQFKKSRQSVMDGRNVTYQPEDILKPF